MKKTCTVFWNHGILEMKGTPGSHLVQLPTKNIIQLDNTYDRD